MGLPTSEEPQSPELRFHTACGSQDNATHSTFNSVKSVKGEFDSAFISLGSCQWQHSQSEFWFLIDNITALLERILGAL